MIIFQLMLVVPTMRCSNEDLFVNYFVGNELHESIARFLSSHNFGNLTVGEITIKTLLKIIC